MKLTKQQKYAIRRISILAYSDSEKNGKPYYQCGGKEIEFEIPQFGEILKTMFENIKNAGFAKVKRCSPFEANCIIRVYKDLHHQYDFGECYNIYGARCYTKTNGVWKTSDGINNYAIDYSRHMFRLNLLLPDESLLIHADFVDYYVKIIN